MADLQDWAVDMHGPEPDDPDPWFVNGTITTSTSSEASSVGRGISVEEIVRALGEGHAQMNRDLPQDVTERLMSLLPELGVYSWGSGQAHSWTKPDAWTPCHTRELLGKRVLQVGAGSRHALCVTANGELYAFGSNNYGQCGGWRGAEYARIVTGFPSRCHIVQADGGISFSAALDSQGRVWTWGRNHVGQLGIGSTGTQRRPQLVRGALEGLRVVRISCGSSHMGALTDSGHLYMWGWGAYGRLGLGHESTTYHPARVMGILGVSTIMTFTCGAAHTLCVTEDNRLYSWGYNLSKQLGYNWTRVPSNSSPRYVLLREDDEVIQVACGEYHSLALTKSGSVYAWGGNTVKQLGLDSSRGRVVGRATHIPSIVMSDVVYISAGGSTSAAIRKNGDLFTWGKGTHGQRGTVIGTVPTVVYPFDYRLPVAHVAMGHSFGVAVTQFVEIPRPPCLLTQHIAELYEQVTASTVDSHYADVDAPSSKGNNGPLEQDWVDVHLHCRGGGVVKAHKIVLACASNYFRTLLVPELPILADPVQDSFAPTLCSLSEEEEEDDEESLQVLDVEQGGGCVNDDDGKAKEKDCPSDPNDHGDHDNDNDDDNDNDNDNDDDDDDDDESSEAWWRITPAGSASTKPKAVRKSRHKAGIHAKGRKSASPPSPAAPSSAAAYTMSKTRAPPLRHKPAFAAQDQDPTSALTRRTVDLSLPHLSCGAATAMVRFLYTGKFTCPDDRDLVAIVEHSQKHGPVTLARVASRTFLVRSRLYRLEQIALAVGPSSSATYRFSTGHRSTLARVLLDDAVLSQGGGGAQANDVHLVARRLLNSEGLTVALHRTLGLTPGGVRASAGTGSADAVASSADTETSTDADAGDSGDGSDTPAAAGTNGTPAAAGTDVGDTAAGAADATPGGADDTDADAVPNVDGTLAPDAADDDEGDGDDDDDTPGDTSPTPANPEGEEEEEESHPLLDERIHDLISGGGALFPGGVDKVAGAYPGHSEHVVDLSDAINAQALSDVAFKIEDRFLLGNRAVLSARCPKLRAMFQSGMKESHDKAITISYASYEVYEAMLQWLYLDHAAVIKPDLSPELLVLADEYGLEDLRLRCERVIAQCLDHDNVVSLLCLADRHQAPYLRSECKFYILGAWDDLDTSTLASELPSALYNDLLVMRAQGQPKQGRSCSIL